MADHDHEAGARKPLLGSRKTDETKDKDKDKEKKDKDKETHADEGDGTTLFTLIILEFFLWAVWVSKSNYVCMVHFSCVVSVCCCCHSG